MFDKQKVQEELAREAGYDIKRQVEANRLALEEAEKKRGVKFKFGVPDGYKKPVVNWDAVREERVDGGTE